MKITVKLFATFRSGREKINIFDLKEGTTSEDILKILGIKKEEIAIFLINGLDGKYEGLLKDGDLLAIFPPIGGG